MRRLLIKPAARRDLTEIWHYIAFDSPVNADGVIERLYKAMNRLCEWPGIGHRRTDVPDRSIHFYTEKPYVVAFKYSRQAMTVLRVLHGARDFPRLFRDR